MSTVEAAQYLAGQLVAREVRGPGDMQNAMRRLEARYGIPWRVFWSFRYRPPAKVMVDVWLGLKAAYDADCERQMRRLEHDMEVARAMAPSLEHPVLTSTAVALDDLVASEAVAGEEP